MEDVKEKCDILSFTYNLYIDLSRSVGGSPSQFITLIATLFYVGGFPDSSVGKESACNTGGPSSIPGSRRSPGERIGYPLQYSWASLVAQLVKTPPAMRETWVRSLGWEDHSGLENSMTCIVHGVTKSLTQLNDFHFLLYGNKCVVRY